MDAVTLAVVRGAMEQVCDEMDMHLIRSALSPIISETNDCAHGVYDADSGETIAQGRFGLPVFLAQMQFSVQAVIEKARAEGGLQPGDMWIMNDVYVGGTHLNDVTLVAPYFHDDQLLAVLANTGHWMDVGGATPGGWAPTAPEIHYEGTIIPPVKLYEAGRLNQALVDMIMANVRIPKEIKGDLTAMSAAISLGRDRLGALVKRYGVGVIRECWREMSVRSERQMRSHIEEIPDGVYEFSDWLDNDGVVDEPLEVRLRVEVSGDDMLVDFTGSSPASMGPMNFSRSTAISACHVALKHIFPDVPVNGGTFRPVRFSIPKGSILDAAYPRAVGGELEIIGHTLEAMFGALAQAIPSKVPACSFGTTGVVTASGRRPETGAYFVAVFPYPGGYGASSGSDGLVNGTPPQSQANFMSLEASEHRYPLRFDHFALREDSGGAGAHRGGCGTSYRFTATSEIVVSILGDRADNPPFGIAGGGSGAPNRVRLQIGGQEMVPPLRTKLERQPLRAGDSVWAQSPGGGGFGDPLTRDADAIERDLRLGYISRRTAEDIYGAVLIGGEGGDVLLRVDRAATERQRLSRNGPAKSS